jgi:predicted nucleic acid-binding protein
VAIEIAATGQLSAYGSFYAALAAVLEAPLVTADRRLAAAVPGSVLVE